MDRKQLIDLLYSVRIAPTSQRLAIAEYLLSEHRHASAEQIISAVYQHTQSSSVSKATVHNTLKLLIEKKLIKKIVIDHTQVFYDSNLSSHHHIYNLDTGELTDIPSNSCELKLMTALPEGYNLDGVELTLKVQKKRETTPQPACASA